MADSAERGLTSTAAQAAELAREARRAKRLIRRNARVRLEAGLVYMTSAEGMSIADLATDPRFASVSERTLERWSKADRWVERRTEFFETWATRAKEKLGSQLTQQRLREMSLLAEVREIAIERIRDEMTQPKSLEGMIKVFLDIGRRSDEIVSGIAVDLTPQAVEDKRVAAPPAPVLPDNEVSALAQTLLSMRRQALRAELAAEPQVVDVSPGNNAPSLDAVEDVSQEVEDENGVETGDKAVGASAEAGEGAPGA